MCFFLLFFLLYGAPEQEVVRLQTLELLQVCVLDDAVHTAAARTVLLIRI